MLAVHVSCDILAPVFALRNVRSIFKLIQLEAWQHSIHDDNCGEDRHLPYGTNDKSSK